MMVNPGYRSRACEYCRSLKSKCDEERPTCGRCAKRGRTCVYGAAEQRFRSMNTWSATNVQNRVVALQAKRSYQANPKKNASTGAVVFHHYGGPQAPEPARQIPLNWPAEAIGPFFRQFIAQPDALASTWGFMTTLPSLYENAADGKYLSEAVNATALAHMANVSKISRLEKQAGECYRNALVKLGSAFNNPKGEMLERTLITIMLLSLYEAISGASAPREVFKAHFIGQATVMRMFLSDRSSYACDKSIVGLTNRMLVSASLAQRTPPPKPLPLWALDTYRSWLDKENAQFGVRVADVCSRVREIQEVPDEERGQGWSTNLAKCVDDALALNDDIEVCMRHAPAEWKAQSLSPNWRASSAISERTPPEALSNVQYPIPIYRPPVVDNFRTDYPSPPDSNQEEPLRNLHPNRDHSSPYTPRLDIYHSPTVCHMWNYLRSTRLQLFRSMIDLHLLLLENNNENTPMPLPTVRPPASYPAITAIIAQLSNTIHDICATTAYLFGDLREGIDAPRHESLSPIGGDYQVAILWNLNIVCGIPGLAGEVKDWILGAFERIGTVGNIRHGLNLKRLHGEETME